MDVNKKIIAGALVTFLAAQALPLQIMTVQANAGQTVQQEQVTPHSEMYVETTAGNKITIDLHNTGRKDNTMVIYTDSYGKKTQTNPWGYEVAVDQNGTVSEIRKTGEGDDSGMAIPARGYVLSAHGAKRELLHSLQVGDKLTLHGLSLVDLNKSVTFELTALNPNATNNPGGVDASGTPFPGFRGGDQLVAYDADWESETTGTNDYGYELIVTGTKEDGVITSIGGNNSVVPSDGYVLSGHGTAATFLINEGLVGAKVTLDEASKEVTISVTPQSLLTMAEAEITNAEARYTNAQAEVRDIPYELAAEAIQTAKTHYQEAVELAKQLEDETLVTDELQYAFLDAVDAVKNNALLVQYRTLESRVVEGRAIWHRPTETSLAGVQSTLASLQANNINVLYLETFFSGYTIYPSANEIAVQRPEFANANYGDYGNDLLQAFVEEAKNYGIEVHTWVHDFFVGYEGFGSAILEQKPEWTLLNYDGTASQKLEGGPYYFMDPSNPEVRAFLIDIYSEMVTNYQIDGLQLDYIRYPVGRYKNDNGYNEGSIQRFKEATGLPADADIRALMDKDTNPEWETYWNQWNSWKQNNISTFVAEVQDTLKGINQELVISTAIFADIEEAKNTKMQNWPLWVESGWIDVTAPMAYYKDTKTVEAKVSAMVEYVGGNALNYAGLAPTFIGMTPEHNAYQIQAARDASAQGSAIFASQNVLGLEDVQTVLTEGTHREQAVAPHGDVQAILDATFADITDKAQRLYLPQGYMTAEQLAQLTKDFEKVTSPSKNEATSLKNIGKDLQKIANKTTTYAQGAASERLQEDFNYLADIFATRANMLGEK